MNSYNTPARNYAEGIGNAVADRTVNRIKPDGTRENWAEVAERVAQGNAMMRPGEYETEFHPLHHHLRKATILLSGRHLQHGDATQPNRVQEVFTNCSTSAASFITFYLLLNGSGVGRAYDDQMMAVDWSKMPRVMSVIDQSHPDVADGSVTGFMDRRNAAHLYQGSNIHVFDVPDSREGWAQAIARMETMAHAGIYKDDVLLLDFSSVRPRGAPIKGMQNRPSSGPIPLMESIRSIALLRDCQMPMWRQAMYVDQYLAECVLVGGARRAARMATKDWRDPTVVDFIGVKQGNFLWTSNNSVTVDAEFWSYVNGDYEPDLFKDPALPEHARRVFEAACQHSYFDGTGEPGFINQDKLVANNDGLDDPDFLSGNFVSDTKLNITSADRTLLADLAGRFAKSDYKMITNPCGEITLTKLGGYCVIGDVVPFHAATLAEAEDAFRVTTRALIRTNLMPCLYRREVNRTNRIGVSITGLHEYAWKFFGLGFRDMLDEVKARDFWLSLSRYKRAVVEEGRAYSSALNVGRPHTDTTIKPAGTTSKLFGLSEGAHLPALREYLRYVQFRNDDPLVTQYQALGYPSKKLVKYVGTTVIGFPTVPTICGLKMGDKLVTAPEATPEEQYQYLRLLEKYWIVGVELHPDVDGVYQPLANNTGNQVSYTLKYDPAVVDYAEFKRTLQDGQSSVRCCSVMPGGHTDTSAYEYLPETPVSKFEFQEILSKIKKVDYVVKEEIGFEHVDCGSGACPVDFREDVGTSATKVDSVVDDTHETWILFSGPSCPWCIKAKELLTERGIEFEEINVDSTAKMQYFQEMTGLRTVPVIIHNGIQIAGYPNLVAHLNSRYSV